MRARRNRRNEPRMVLSIRPPARHDSGCGTACNAFRLAALSGCGPEDQPMTEQDRHALRPLLERVVHGDRQAYEELFVRLRPYLHALVRRTLGPDQGGIDYSAIVQS